MKKIFYFGEKVQGFKIRVLNERETRAGAGILFFLAMISFMSAWLTGNFYFMKWFVIIFIADFIIRIFLNPKYSPSLIIGRFIVNNQVPEYVGALQKRFAWGLGLALAIAMFFLVVVNNIVGPINLLICLICLILLFFETAFGICLGCKIYNLFYSQEAELCPGESCKLNKKEEIQIIDNFQVLAIVGFLFLMGIFFSFNVTKRHNNLKVNIDKNSISHNIPDKLEGNCQVPDWAIKIGHKEKWKLHHGCK